MQLFSPKLAGGDPKKKKRHVSIITECVARTQSKHTQIYETALVAAIAMMLSNDIPQQYEVGDSPDILHNSLFPLLNMALMSHCRLSARRVGGFITPRLYFLPLSVARERNSETCIVYKTNGSCVEQIVLLKQARFVTLEGERNFNIKRAITCMLPRFMRP